MRRLSLSALIGGCCVVAAAFTPVSATAAAAAVKTVRYDRYTLRVPARWPVFKLASDPSACVRFDRHAVYLGRPSGAQRCPAHSVGRTEAILVQPLLAGAAATRSGPPPAAMLAQARTTRARGSIGELVLPGRGLVVTATWGRHPGTIARALGVRSIPAQPSGLAARARVGPSARLAMVAGSRPAGVRRRFSAVNVGGLGFDSCAAPSTAAMSAWLQYSPFRAAAIYIGGANSACAQPNLSASWVTTETAAGWQFIPVYVGLQAPGSSCGCAVIAPAQATAQGAAAASDAIAQAQALGIGPGNPIYYDMEAYARTARTTSTVLAFLSAWTTQLSAAGYISGVYSSALSGITDFVGALGTPFAEPADIWIADWNGQATASDPYVPAADWSLSQRLHQYRGGHTDNYGGVSINIDTNYLDGATATGGLGVPTVGAGALPDGTFVSYQGKVYRLAGGAPLYVHGWSAYGGAPQPTAPLVAAQWQALKPVPADGTFIRATATGRVYRIAGGAPIYVSNWSAFAGPQQAIVIDRWDIHNVSNPLSHLRAAPANGTIVKGVPSGVYWQFNSSGMRTAAPPSSTAVSVDDVGLGSFFQSPTAFNVTLRGVAKRNSKLRVTLAAGANAPALQTIAVELPRGLHFTQRSTRLMRGLGVWNAHRKPLFYAVALRRGVLTITLDKPHRTVRIAVASPMVSASKGIAAAIAARALTSLQVVVTATDTNHDRAVLTLDPATA